LPKRRRRPRSSFRRRRGKLSGSPWRSIAPQSVIGRQGAEIDKLKGYNRTLSEQNNELEEKLQELQPKRSRGKGMDL
ncbi:hypothetical protein ACTG1W_23490, partial [Aeromonas dhakensis]|uniref:hypothetical protein n=1 Tax=Aeromonas dhakensis TaxID=196024 RepID=UPI003F7A2B06